jgi:hypothetical protein
MILSLIIRRLIDFVKNIVLIKANIIFIYKGDYNIMYKKNIDDFYNIPDDYNPLRLNDNNDYIDYYDKVLYTKDIVRIFYNTDKEFNEQLIDKDLQGERCIIIDIGVNDVILLSLEYGYEYSLKENDIAIIIKI